MRWCKGQQEDGAQHKSKHSTAPPQSTAAFESNGLCANKVKVT